MIAFAAAVEPLRIANRLARGRLYAWRLASETGAPVRCSNNGEVGVDGALDEASREATVMVCGGLDIQSAATKPVLTWLRRQARLGSRIGALCTGAHVLARAGLLEGRRCTIHWENHAAFAEAFESVEVTRNVYEIDGDRLTCAGGVAAMDMMLALIGQEHGPDFARLVADQMIVGAMRGAMEEQRLSAPARLGTRHPRLVTIIKRMEQHIEEPVSPTDLAEGAGMSTRQLERLFRRYLNKSPKRYYMEIRLQRARDLLLQTDMSVIAVALASGFTSPAHFSKCYRAEFGRTPYHERGSPEPVERG